jgi:hypothetical protein
MKRQSNREIIDEMKLMLEDKPSLTLESFVMPHMEENEEEEYNGEEQEPNVPIEEPEEMTTDNSGIEKELTQIRKIALSAINKLADRPTSNQYKVMKQIWNQVDKATEIPEDGKAE